MIPNFFFLFTEFCKQDNEKKYDSFDYSWYTPSFEDNNYYYIFTLLQLMFNIHSQMYFKKQMKTSFLSFYNNKVSKHSKKQSEFLI